MSQEEPLKVDSVESLIFALGDSGATHIRAELDDYEDGGGPAGQLWRCRDCVRLFAAVAFSRTALSLTLRGAPEELVMAVAEAAPRNAALRALSVDTWGGRPLGEETCLALARALEAHPTLRAFELRCLNDEALGDEMVRTLARALEAAPKLISFALHAFGTGVGEESGHALARALKSHRTLESFIFDARRTGVGSETGLAMADAVEGHPSLQAFSLCLDEELFDDTVAAMADVLVRTVTPLACKVSGVRRGERFEELTARNEEVQARRHALTALARCTADGGFFSLAESAFRREVLRFFLPAGCKQWPVELARGARGAAAPPEEGAAAEAAVVTVAAGPGQGGAASE